MASKHTGKRKDTRRSDPGEYRFKIEAFTPETMPMARLAEYIKELAEILGEPKDVHLIALEPGSTVLIHRIEHEAIPKVRERANAVRRGDAPRDPLVAYRKVNQMLREDNGRAVFQQGKRGPRILEFPGRDEVEESFANIKQSGTIEGFVIRVGGTGDSIPILLESEGRQIAGCHTNRQIAKDLAKCLFEPVRVGGMGYWIRDAEGEWALRHFRIATFEQLEDMPLSTALTKLRSIDAEWDEDAYDDVMADRHGRVANGGT